MSSKNIKRGEEMISKELLNEVLKEYPHRKGEVITRIVIDEYIKDHSKLSTEEE